MFLKILRPVNLSQKKKPYKMLSLTPHSKTLIINTNEAI